MGQHVNESAEPAPKRLTYVAEAVRGKLSEPILIVQKKSRKKDSKSIYYMLIIIVNAALSILEVGVLDGF